MPRRWFGSRLVGCQLTPAAGVAGSPLAAIGGQLSGDWRHHPGRRFRVAVDVTPLERGSFGHLGTLEWRIQVDKWVEVSELPS